MFDTTTIARPYAKAIFEYALAAKQLGAWSKVLYELAEITLNCEVMQFIDNPSTTPSQHAELLISLLSGLSTSLLNELGEASNNLLLLLADNKRLAVLPDIFAQFQALKSEHEKTIVANVKSFIELTGDEQERLVKSLTQKLKRQVSLDITIDKSLLGGVIIQAGDLVIDGSVRGKLNKLSADLAA